MLPSVLTAAFPASSALLVGPRIAQLRPLFEQRGYTAVVAVHGLEAIARLDASGFPLVVLELALGDLTAIDFLGAARTSHARTIFLLVDDAAQSDGIVKAMQAGFDGFIAAPPDESRLFAEVERHLARLRGSAAANEFDDAASTQTGMTSVGRRGAADTREALASDLQLALGVADEAVGALVTDQGNQRLAPRDEPAALQLAAIARALEGVLDGPLDEEAARGLRSRVQMAQINDVERQALLAEVDALRQARRAQNEELEAARRALAAGDGSADRIAELEGALALAHERVVALDAALAAAKETHSVVEVERRALAQEGAAVREQLAQLERAAADARERASLTEATCERLRGEAAAATAALNEERCARADAEAASRAAHEAELARVKHAAATVRDDLERRQARLGEEEARVAVREREAVAAAVDAARAEARVDLEAALERQREEFEATLAKATAAHEAAMATAATVHASAVARVTADADEAQQVAVAAVITRAKAEAERTTARAVAAAVAEVRDEAAASERARLALAAEVQGAIDRATDFELQLEEARMRIDFLNEENERITGEAEERVRRAEAEFKKERLRLIDEKQAAASGSQEAALKLQGLIDANQAQRLQIADLTAERDRLAASETTARSAHQRADDDLRRCRDELAAALARHEDVLQAQALVQATLGAVQAHARTLEEQLAAAEQAARTAEAAAEAELDAARRARDEAEARLTAAEAAVVDERARHAQELDERLGAFRAGADERLQAERARFAEQLAAERARTDEAHAQTKAAVEQLHRETTAHAAALEAAVGAAREAHRVDLAVAVADAVAARADRDDARAARDAERTLVEALRAEVTETKAALEDTQRRVTAAAAARDDASVAADEIARLGAALADAELARTSLSAARADAVDELARLRVELDAASAARVAAAEDAARVRTEAQTVHAQAAGSVAQWQRRVTTLEEERARQATTEAAVVAERDALARELAAIRSVQVVKPEVADAAEVDALRARVEELAAALAAQEPAALMTMRSLLDGLAPLHQGLDAAVDYIASFEDNDPAVSAHLRTLRLLTATLGRLLAVRARAGG
jgi:hypothetical protein